MDSYTAHCIAISPRSYAMLNCQFLLILSVLCNITSLHAWDTVHSTRCAPMQWECQKGHDMCLCIPVGRDRVHVSCVTALRRTVGVLAFSPNSHTVLCYPSAWLRPPALVPATWLWPLALSFCGSPLTRVCWVGNIPARATSQNGGNIAVPAFPYY